MTVADSQLTALIELRGEIKEIDRAARPSVSGLDRPCDATTPPDSSFIHSYGMLSGLSPLSSAEQTVVEIVASVHNLLARLAPVATLETSRDGLTARTVIQYTGRAASVWSNSPSSELASGLAGAHLASVEKTYALRTTFAETIAAVGSALVSIALAVANPLTVLHALASARALKQALERLVAAAEAAN